jgi:multiple sugar transport system permease protein
VATNIADGLPGPALVAGPGPGSAAPRARLSTRLAPYLLLSPALVLFLTFVVAPVIGAIVISFLNWNLLSTSTWAGLDNYNKLLHDGELHAALRHTLVFTFWSIVLHVVVGLGLALAVNRPMHKVTRYVLRTTFFFPFLISWAAVALIWQYALDPTFGVATFYGSKVGLPNDWLLDKSLALPALILVDLWKTIGFAFVVFLAGLQAIPPSLYEAARVDGAGSWHRFWHVTLPMLSPTIFFIVVISFIGAFQIFEPMFIMTRGGPDGSTESIVQYLYETAFRDFQVGYASAIAMLVFAVILVATLIQFALRRRWVHEG